MEKQELYTNVPFYSIDIFRYYYQNKEHRLDGPALGCDGDHTIIYYFIVCGKRLCTLFFYKNTGTYEGMTIHLQKV
jgi:hypothetical protein